MNAKKMTTYQLVLTALMTAVVCILGPWSLNIPISPVPISMGNLGILLAVAILGTKYGTLSCVLYLLIGLIGLPVFSNFGSGIGKLAGPTGGYLIGYIPMVVVCGLVMSRFMGKAFRDRVMQALGMVLGTAVLYVFGTAWLAIVAGMTFGQALAAGVIPFIPGDLVKILIVVLLAPKIRSRLVKANLLA